jgi:hypothetical protein
VFFFFFFLGAHACKYPLKGKKSTKPILYLEEEINSLLNIWVRS